MPNYLALKDKQTGKTYVGQSLIEVDERLCAALGVPVSPVDFYLGWVDWIGLYLNDNWADVRAKGHYTERQLPVIDWLEQTFDLNSYAEIGRR